MDETFYDKLMVIFRIIQSTTLCITGKTNQSRPIECMYMLALMHVNDIGDMCINLDCVLSLLDLYLYRSDDQLYPTIYFMCDSPTSREIVLGAVTQDLKADKVGCSINANQRMRRKEYAVLRSDNQRFQYLQHRRKLPQNR